MLEQEIKLHVPAAARRAVLAEVDAAGKATRIRLRAQYFDTPDRQLARQRAAIRLRLEGRRWVQTFKMAGADATSRLELNHPRPRAELDLSVYVGTPAEAVFAELSDALVMRYETDVRRVLRQVRVRTGVIELAYDTGHVRAGDLELPIDELEMEHVSGRLAAMFTLADRWVCKHALILDPRSKAERGDRLAEAAQAIAEAPLDRQAAVREQALMPFAAPRHRANVKLSANATPAEALDAITGECLDQVARNAVLASGIDLPPGHEDAAVEAIHQLRVGLRRLRSAWKLYDGWAPLPEGTLQDGAREQFGAVGALRDRDVLAGDVLPRLEAAGMPPLPRETRDAGEVADVVGGVSLQRWLVAMAAWEAGVRADPLPEEAAGADATAGAPTSPRLAALLRRRLHKWHRRVLTDAQRIGKLDDEARHGLRKRAKRLRYGIDLSESLLGKRVRSYKKQLAALQDVLGEMNDLVVAREALLGMCDTHPQAWFGVGWIAQRQAVLLADAAQAARALKRAKRFWQ